MSVFLIACVFVVLALVVGCCIFKNREIRHTFKLSELKSQEEYKSLILHSFLFAAIWIALVLIVT